MSPLPDAAERAAALDLGRHVIAVAPAGSGKTGLLVQRLLAALAVVESPEQVVAITFTNKAAAEIRARVLGTLERAARGADAKDAHDEHGLALARQVLAHDAARAAGERWRLIEHPDRLRATTIDGLQAQIAAELPLLSGLGGRPSVVEDARRLYEDAILALFAELEDPAAPAELLAAAARWLRAYGNRLDRLVEPFADLLERREQWQHILATDWDWAAQDARVLAAIHGTLQRRFIDALGGPGFEALCTVARDGSPHPPLAWAVSLASPPSPDPAQADLFAKLAAMLLTDKGKIRRSVTIGNGFPPRSGPKAAMEALLAAHQDDDPLAEAAAALVAAPPAAMPPAQVALREALRVLLRRLLAHLRTVMGERGETDFVGVAEAARAALLPREAGAHAYGDALLKRDAQLRHLLVDEMQDTSEGQLELLRALTLGWQPGDGRSLFLVGDPQQSIYAFRKAEVRLFQQLWHTRALGELPLHRLRLRANFRSAPDLVDWFNRVFEVIFPTCDDELAGAVAYSPSVAASTRGEPAAIALHPFNADGAGREAETMAALANAYARSGGSVALLARARPQVHATVARLRAQGLRIACQDVDPLAARPAVRDVLALARALWQPEDRLSWALLLRAPFVGLSWADLVALSAGRTDLSWPARLALADEAALSADGRARVARLRHALAGTLADADRAGLASRVETLWTVLGGAACIDDDAEHGDVRRCFALLREQAANGIVDERGFERAVAELYAGSGGGAIQVMTVHKAKGLEFDHVLMVGCGRAPRTEDPPLLHLIDTAQGPLLVPKPPAFWAGRDDAEPARRLYRYVHGLHARSRAAEGLRLLYVATTRARRTLDLSFCARRDDRTPAPKPAKGSFAAELLRAPAARAVLREEAADVVAPAVEPSREAPCAPRLRLDVALPEAPTPYRPRASRALRPSEAVLSVAEAKRLDEEDVYAQLVGTMLHQALAKIVSEGLARWSDAGAARAASMAAGFRRLGLPEPEVEPAVARVLTLLRRMLASDTARWLLGPHRWAQAEYALAGWRDGRWVSASLDRCFETVDDELWVVDYKAAARPVAPAAIDDYVAAGTEHYRPQLSLYAELLGADRGTTGVKAALYFIEADRLVVL